MGAAEPKEVSGIPPWHASAFVGIVLALAVSCQPSKASLDAVSTVDKFTSRVFPDLISLRALGIIRSLLAVICWSVLFRMVFLETGWTLYTNYRPYSKLKNTWITLRGITTMCPFTSLSYFALALNFSFAAAIALQEEFGIASQFHEPWFLRTAIILWEIAGPSALLVSTVVRYAIWPIVLAGGKPHNLAGFRNQMMHNFNSIFALTEMTLLGGLPIFLSHMSLPVIFGGSYVVFSWCACGIYGKPSDGPQYIYWFFDTTLGKTTTIAVVALTSTLVVSFNIFIAVDALIALVGGTFINNTLLAAFFSSLVIRTR